MAGLTLSDKKKIELLESKLEACAKRNLVLAMRLHKLREQLEDILDRNYKENGDYGLENWSKKWTKRLSLQPQKKKRA